MGFFLHTTNNYFYTGRYVILDSGFCVLKGLIKLRKKGIFACAVINKRIYWPSMVSVKDIEDNFGEVEVGEIDTIQGTVDDIIYNLWVTKEPNYVMKMMATGSILLVDDT